MFYFKCRRLWDLFEHIYFATDTNLNDFLIPENKELEDTSNNFFENYPNVQRLTDGEAFIEGRVMERLFQKNI